MIQINRESIQLTKENAYLYENKFLDAKRRRFHHYPLCIKRNQNGELMIVDNTNGWMEIPGKKDLFNAFYFDIVSDDIEEAEDFYKQQNMIYQKNNAIDYCIDLINKANDVLEEKNKIILLKTLQYAKGEDNE